MASSHRSSSPHRGKLQPLFSSANPNVPQTFQEIDPASAAGHKPRMNFGGSPGGHGFMSKSTAAASTPSQRKFHMEHPHHGPGPSSSNFQKQMSSSSTGRSAKKAVGDGSKLDTVVFKNFPLKTTVEDVRSALTGAGISAEPLEVILHDDASLGVFKGTVFVKFGNQSAARECLEGMPSPFEFGGRKVKMEMLKKSKRDRFGNLAERGLSSDHIGGQTLNHQEDPLSEREMEEVRRVIQSFAEGRTHHARTHDELRLKSTDRPSMRKYQHSVAERFELYHTTSEDKATGLKFVILQRREQDKTRAGAEERKHSGAFAHNKYEQPTRFQKQTGFHPAPPPGSPPSTASRPSKGKHADADLQLVFLAAEVQDDDERARDGESLNIGLLPTPNIAPSPQAATLQALADPSKAQLPAQMYNHGQAFSGKHATKNLPRTGAHTTPHFSQPPPPSGPLSPFHLDAHAEPPGLEFMSPSASVRHASFRTASSGSFEARGSLRASVFSHGGATTVSTGRVPTTFAIANQRVNILAGATPTVRAVEGLIQGQIQTNLPPGPYAFGPFKPGELHDMSPTQRASLSPSKLSRDMENRAKGPDGTSGFMRMRSTTSIGSSPSRKHVSFGSSPSKRN